MDVHDIIQSQFLRRVKEHRYYELGQWTSTVAWLGSCVVSPHPTGPVSVCHMLLIELDGQKPGQTAFIPVKLE